MLAYAIYIYIEREREVLAQKNTSLPEGALLRATYADVCWRMLYIGAGAAEHVAAGGGGATSSNARVVLHFEHAYARCMPRHALPGTQFTGVTGTQFTGCTGPPF